MTDERSIDTSDGPSDGDLRVISRRRFMGLTTGLFLAGGLAGIYGFLVEPNRLQVTHHTLRVPDLPDHLDGYTIAHVTDAHLGPWRMVHDAVFRSLEDLQPDLVVSTGDLVERPADIPTFRRFLDRLRGLDGELLCVLGNWENRKSGYFIDDVEAVYRDLQVDLLRNDQRTLADGHVVVVGAGDALCYKFDPERAFEDVPDAPFRLLLLHEPAPFDWRLPAAPTFDLCLAGHTHGGQINFGSWAPVTPTFSGRFVSGFYETRRGLAYISRGIGMTSLRVRFLCPPELPIFTLTPADA